MSNRSPALEGRFFISLKRSIELAKAQTEFYSLRFDQVRRIILGKFPYAVYFEHDDQAIYVHSVFHESRNPTRFDRLRKF